MRFNNQGGLEDKMMFDRQNQRETRSIRPSDAGLKLKIQMERDFQKAKALSEGDAEAISIINDLPDAHFQKIIEEREKNK